MEIVSFIIFITFFYFIIKGLFSLFTPSYSTEAEISSILDQQYNDMCNSIAIELRSSKQKVPLEPQEQLEDKELAELRLELELQASKFQDLRAQHLDIQDDIDEFNREYNLHLGEIIKTILNVKKEILYKKTIQHQEFTTGKEFIKNDRIFQEYEDAKTHYDEFHVSYEHFKETQKEKVNLNKQDRAQLKQLYNEAVGLCHANIVTDEQKQPIAKMMKMLKAAYKKQDLEWLKELLKGSNTIRIIFNSHASINDKTLLKEKIKEYRENITHIELEIKVILQDENYQTITAIEDWDKYFKGLKNKLEEEEQRLENEVKAVLEEKKQESFPILNDVDKATTEWMQILWGWSDKNNLPINMIPRKIESLLSLTVLDLTGKKLDSLPDEIVNLKNLTELSLWDCGLRYLPKNIIELRSLKKLNIRTNPALMLTIAQEQWLSDLTNTHCIIYKDTTLSINDFTFDKIKQDSEQRLQELPYSYDEQCKIVLEWIIAQFLRIYKYDLTQDYKALVRVQDASKLVVRELQNSGSSKIELRYLANNSDFIVDNLTFATFGIQNIPSSNKAQEDSLKTKSVVSKKIEGESSQYASQIKSIEVPNFEKIRRYCNNLVNENKADEMQKYLAESGKMHKAIIYDALEQFIVHLDGKEITLIDWGCGQGLASMLVLDYIREKQLNVEVNKVVLIDDDAKALSRAMVHVGIFTFDEIEILALASDDIGIIHSPLTIMHNGITLNLFANDQVRADLSDIDLGSGYAVCLSNQSSTTIDKLCNMIGGREISNRNNKIGRFQRYERIFKFDCIRKELTSKNGISTIDLDEIPF